jgi:hypothetical protein
MLIPSGMSLYPARRTMLSEPTPPAESRILVTLDRDFANIEAYPPRQHAGIIVLRLKTQDKLTLVSYLRDSL